MAAGFELIQDTYTLLPQALLKQVTIPPAAYNGKMAGEWDGTSSDNWDMVACAFELINHYHGKPTDKPLDFIRDTFISGEWLEGGQGLGQGEFSGEYTNHHIAPGWVSICLMRHFGKTDSEMDLLAQRGHYWLRAWIGWLTLGTNGAVGYELGNTEKVPTGPRVVRARGLGRRFDPPLVQTAATGERGVVYGDGGFFFVTAKGQNDAVTWFALREADDEPRLVRAFSNYPGIASALKARGLYYDPFTPEERAKLRAAAAGNLDELDWVAGLCRGFQAPSCLPWVRRYDANSVTFGISRAVGSSTCAAYAQTLYPNGYSDTLVADYGYRDTGANEWFKAGNCVVDDANRIATAQRNDQSLPAVVMGLPTENLLWKLDTLPDGTIKTWRHDKTTAPPEVPPITPPVMPESPKKKASWIERMGL